MTNTPLRLTEQEQNNILPMVEAARGRLNIAKVLLVTINNRYVRRMGASPSSSPCRGTRMSPICASAGPI